MTKTGEVQNDDGKRNVLAVLSQRGRPDKEVIVRLPYDVLPDAEEFIQADA